MKSVLIHHGSTLPPLFMPLPDLIPEAWAGKHWRISLRTHQKLALIHCPGCWPGSSLHPHTGASDSTSPLVFTSWDFAGLPVPLFPTIHHSLCSLTQRLCKTWYESLIFQPELAIFLAHTTSPAQAASFAVLCSVNGLITAYSSTCPRPPGSTSCTRSSLCTASVFLTLPLVLCVIVSPRRILDHNGYQSLDRLPEPHSQHPAIPSPTPPSPHFHSPYHQITSFISPNTFLEPSLLGRHLPSASLQSSVEPNHITPVGCHLHATCYRSSPHLTSLITIDISSSSDSRKTIRSKNTTI